MARRDRRRILVVGRDEELGRRFLRLFDLDELEADICCDGRGVLMALSEAERYDVAVMRYEAPGSIGYAELEQAAALEHRGGMPIVMLTDTASLSGRG